jgi:hypothetical protein
MFSSIVRCALQGPAAAVNSLLSLSQDAEGCCLQLYLCTPRRTQLHCKRARCWQCIAEASRRSSMQVFHVALSACLITTVCCLLADVLLKITFRSDCFYNGHAAPSDSALSPIAVSCLVCGALAFSANFAFLLFKSRSKRGFSLLRVLFSKWQPIYFIIVSMERIIFSALSIRDYIQRDRLGTCILSFEAENQIFAAVFLWNIINFLMGVLIFCCDLDSNFTPTLRRWLYGFFAMCSMSDVIASYVWGNALATEDHVSVGTFQFVVGTQITSCVSSQVVISLQLLYVSCRSQSGLAWKYSSLRFQLDTSGAAVKTSSTLRTPLLTDEHDCSAAAAASAPHSPSELRNQPDSSASLLLRLHRRWLSFQNMQLSRSGVFVIPCVRNRGLGVPDPVELARPLFRLNFLKPLHRLADAYPNWYILANASLMLGSFGLSFVSYYGQGVEILVAVMNFAVFVFSFGYFSSKHHNLDRVAAKHVVLSFRFVFCVGLSCIWLSLFFRLAYLGAISFWIWAGILAIVPILFLCLLLDCSPKVSVFVQICISVRTICYRIFLNAALHFFPGIILFRLWLLVLFSDQATQPSRYSRLFHADRSVHRLF